jgi:hypothetical protein
MNTPLKPSLRPARRRGLISTLALTVAVTAAGFAIGCGQKKNQHVVMPPSRYADKGPRKDLAPYLKGTVYERADLINDAPMPVSAFGLVGRLHGTGDSFASTPVRSWMIREMVKRGFGSKLIPGSPQPESVLADPNYAIVETYALVPPGARQGDWVDAYVRGLPRNRTTSLSHGVLFETDLKINGANPQAPSSGVAVWVKVKGPIVTNPAYALENNNAPTGPARESLRRGTIMFNARVMTDRPLMLQLRTPQRSSARAVERRIDEFFQDQNVAAAADEGIIQLWVPRSFRGDWQHFAGLATHLYMDNSAAFANTKAKQLADAARHPGAPLMEISYAWDGLGSAALGQIQPLMTDSDPNVAFAAARAAAFIGDPSGGATAALTHMAGTANHPNQLAAIQILGALPPSTSLNHLLRDLIDTDQSLVRIEAYKVLAQNKDPKVYSTIVTAADKTEKFVLDIVPSEGPPIVYASRRGAPRIAVIGRTPAVTLPITFTALDMRFSITSQPNSASVTLFYRDASGANPVKMISHTDVAELIARMGGEGAPEDARLDFTYGEVLAILQSLSDQKRIASSTPKQGQVALAQFVLQEARGVEDQIFNAPAIPDAGRPAADAGGGRPTGADVDALSPTFPGAAATTTDTGNGDLAPTISGLSPTGSSANKGGRPQ